MERVVDLRADAQPGTLVIEAGALASAVMATWRGRMINEYSSSAVFDGLAAQLAAAGFAEDAAECREFADEERAHGIACGTVLEAAGGTATFTLPEARPLPVHADTTLRAGVIRNVISICCMSETVAVSLIGAERLEMPEGSLRELLTKIWSDEIGHARFGWTFVARELPGLDADERVAVDRYLPIAFAALESHELAHIPVETSWPEEASAYGLCDGADARVLFFETVTDVIVPQLAAHGLRADMGWQERRTA
jgi:hypothetical protein